MAAYIGERVLVRYDPRDMAEIRVYYQDRFLCRAVCQEVAGETVTLKDILQARRRHKRALYQHIEQRQALLDQFLASSGPAAAPAAPAPPHRPVKRYAHE